MTKVTYLGESKAVEFDGVGFEPGKAVDYDGTRLRKLRGNRFFKVEDQAPKPPEKEHPFPTDSKDALEAWAREHLELELDKRKGLKTLIKQVDEAMKNANAD
ncbi:MAG: hypothetical protein FH747_03155 [Stenotrophomonas sp.]|uniref:hypothetical protein n=1 Tax=Stenotrophomonas sp. TaxID=69392 RepID=UPI001355C56C|nr:hypothetical protein [Stenotrophomonas sp.]MTI72586.1 hypothetical protein [Stenotrophomonas sp.]MTI72646.1 hypothetical protein [Stenotrophomonas sp.]